MNTHEANECLLTMLLFDRRDWPAAQLEAWRNAIAQCASVQAARSASDALVKNLAPRDWSLHAWREAYQEALRRQEARLELERPEEEVIPLERYLSRLMVRIGQAGDDQEAQDEYDRFMRHREVFLAGLPEPQ